MIPNEDDAVLNLPNTLTVLRMFCIPVFVLFFYLPWTWSHVLVAFIFIFAGMTDYLDGYLARKLAQTSQLGAFLDPVADKLLVIAALILLVNEIKYPFLAVISVVIACREILVSALREWMAEVGKRASVAVSYLGKLKTVIQFIAICALLLGRADLFHSKHFFWILGYIFLLTAAIMTLWSMFVYLKAAKKALMT